MASVEEASSDILHLLYDIIRSIERDSHDPNQKRDSYDSALKIQDLRNKLQTCRELVQKLPGIDLTQEEQLHKVEALKKQLIKKRELLIKYKSMCHFDTPDMK
ncbi:mediator of RNA polymerase II transcription subunit 9-like [Ornithodoros turicata]|uniref:mediator of RNA polymerase II transcription subunit 9-like n=1 Tax=Ornithodoros turicata TaxID=34597 RepID=UPI00313954EC